MIDNSSRFVLPVMITVAENQSFLNKESGPELFNGKHERLFEFTRPDLSDSTYMVFDENVFIKLISVQSSEDCEQLQKQFPNLSYFYFEATHNQSCRFLSKNDYIVTMLNDISLFRCVVEMYQAMMAYLKSPDDKLSLNMFLNVYLSNYKVIYSPINSALESLLSKYGMEELLSDNILDNVFLSDLSDYLIPGIGSYEQNDGFQLGDEFKKILVSEGSSAIERYIQERIKNVKIVQQTKVLMSEYRCETLSEAMYEYLLVSAYNQDTYRVCTKEKCFTFFKVNKSHPQLYCEHHMASRRRKDTKYKRKQRIKNKDSLKEV